LGSWGNSNQIFFSNIQIALTRFFSFQKWLLGNNTTSASIFYSFGRSMTVSSRFS
jgi:hypothetical protein